MPQRATTKPCQVGCLLSLFGTLIVMAVLGSVQHSNTHPGALNVPPAHRGSAPSPPPPQNVSAHTNPGCAPTEQSTFQIICSSPNMEFREKNSVMQKVYSTLRTKCCLPSVADDTECPITIGGSTADDIYLSSIEGYNRLNTTTVDQQIASRTLTKEQASSFMAVSMGVMSCSTDPDNPDIVSFDFACKWQQVICQSCDSCRVGFDVSGRSMDLMTTYDNSCKVVATRLIEMNDAIKALNFDALLTSEGGGGRRLSSSQYSASCTTPACMYFAVDSYLKSHGNLFPIPAAGICTQDTNAGQCMVAYQNCIYATSKSIHDDGYGLYVHNGTLESQFWLYYEHALSIDPSPTATIEFNAEVTAYVGYNGVHNRSESCSNFNATHCTLRDIDSNSNAGIVVPKIPSSSSNNTFIWTAKAMRQLCNAGGTTGLADPYAQAFMFCRGNASSGLDDRVFCFTDNTYKHYFPEALDVEYGVVSSISSSEYDDNTQQGRRLAEIDKANINSHLHEGKCDWWISLWHPIETRIIYRTKSRNGIPAFLYDQGLADKGLVSTFTKEGQKALSSQYKLSGTFIEDTWNGISTVNNNYCSAVACLMYLGRCGYVEDGLCKCGHEIWWHTIT